MSSILIPAVTIIAPILILATLLTYALYRVYRIPSLLTIENAAQDDSWGNLEILPPPTPDPEDDLESGLRTPEPAQRGTVWNIRRHHRPVELLRFHPEPTTRISFNHNHLSPLSAPLFKQYSSLFSLVNTHPDS